MLLAVAKYRKHWEHSILIFGTEEKCSAIRALFAILNIYGALEGIHI
jgi:hypothetical protein